jgi:hypothetical protein
MTTPSIGYIGLADGQIHRPKYPQSGFHSSSITAAAAVAMVAGASEAARRCCCPVDMFSPTCPIS